MRIHMRVNGQVASVRGSLLALNPQSGDFRVKFDLPLSGNDGVPVQEVIFNNRDGGIVDTTWSLFWTIIS